MANKKSIKVISPDQDPFGPAPLQMTLFADEYQSDENPGHALEKMKIAMLLKTFYKQADHSVPNPALQQAG